MTGLIGRKTHEMDGLKFNVKFVNAFLSDEVEMLMFQSMIIAYMGHHVELHIIPGGNVRPLRSSIDPVILAIANAPKDHW